MSLPPSLSTRIWLVVPLLALAFLLWIDLRGVQRIKYVTGVVSGDATIAAGSPTGYAGGVRGLIVPEQNNDSYHWIAQTQQMLARGEWRVRTIDYENAPLGRDVFTPSPYRWWLGLVAWIDHTLSGRPPGLSVEQATLYSDPLLHVLLFVLSVGLAARCFGAFPAALLSIGLAALFPFAAGYYPGSPDDKSLARICAFLSVFFLLIGLHSSRPLSPGATAVPSSKPDRWFFIAGIMGGFGLWISVAVQVPVIIGVTIGGLIACWTGRRDQLENPTVVPSPTVWLIWSLGGATSSLCFYLVEYYPAHLGLWRLQEIHPLYSLAWLGSGSLLFLTTGWAQKRVGIRSFGFWTGALFVTASLAALPVLMWKSKDAGFLAIDGWSFRLTRLPGSVEALNLWTWLGRDGLSRVAWSTLLPLLLIVPAGWLIMRKKTSALARISIALALGPVVVALGFACWQLGRWNSLAAMLLVLLVVVVWALRESFRSHVAAWVCSILLGLLFFPGLLQLWPPSQDPDQIPLNDSELGGLISRDLAHWLAKHTGVSKPLVLASPNVTTAMYYYGGLRGIGTLSWENQTGLGAAARVFSATTMQEAFLRIQRREITHIIVPSWDNYLNEYVRLSEVQVEDTFLSGLRNWALIPWLRPLHYQLPGVPGYEGQSVSVFEVVEDQDEPTLLSRQAEYFAEMGQLENAAALSQALQRFPADMGAWIARAQVAIARRDPAGLGAALEALTPKLGTTADRYLPWDRRVGLAIAFAQGRQMDRAREQVRRCLTDANEKRLRSISTSSLYNLLRLAKYLDETISDPALRALARDLLPADLRAQI